MGWLLLWTAIGLAQLVVLVGCGWVLWRKGRALWTEGATVASQLGALASQLDGLGWQPDPDDTSSRGTDSVRGGSSSRP